MTVQTVGGTVVLRLAAAGPPLATGGDALEVVAEAWAADAEVVAVPVQRFPVPFFDERTGLAGRFVRTVVDHGLRLAVVGDVTARVARTRALEKFAREWERDGRVWFVVDVAELAGRLAAE